MRQLNELPKVMSGGSFWINRKYRKYRSKFHGLILKRDEELI